MKALVLDCETNGLISNHTVALTNQPHIIEFYGALCAITKKKYTVLEELTMLIKPPYPLGNRPIKAKSKKTIETITGITDALLVTALPFAAHASALQTFIEAAPLVIAHNAQYDREMLDIEFERLGKQVKWPPMRCTIEQTMHINGNRQSLTNLHQYFFNEPFEAHRAKPDVEAVLRCLVEMCKRGWL